MWIWACGGGVLHGTKQWVLASSGHQQLNKFSVACRTSLQSVIMSDQGFGWLFRLHLALLSPKSEK